MEPVMFGLILIFQHSQRQTFANELRNCVNPREHEPLLLLRDSISFVLCTEFTELHFDQKIILQEQHLRINYQM